MYDINAHIYVSASGNFSPTPSSEKFYQNITIEAIDSNVLPLVPAAQYLQEGTLYKVYGNGEFKTSFIYNGQTSLSIEDVYEDRNNIHIVAVLYKINKIYINNNGQTKRVF